MESSTEIICMSFKPQITGKKHTIQSFCDVINSNEKGCRCPVVILNAGEHMKVGEIFKAIKFDDKNVDCYDSLITAYANLDRGFMKDFMLKPGKCPIKIKINVIPYTGLVKSVLIERWYEHFMPRVS